MLANRGLKITLKAAASMATALTLAGCAASPPTANQCGPRPTDEQIQAAVQYYIENENWKDPDSLRLRNVRVQECRAIWNGLINGGGHTIGWEIDFEINAKNSYGGYTGFETKSIIRLPNGKVDISD